MILALDWRNGSRKSLRACVSESNKLSVLFSVWAERHIVLRELACCCGLGNKDSL